jgi:hypothetical protein
MAYRLSTSINDADVLEFLESVKNEQRKSIGFGTHYYKYAIG